MNLLVRLKLTRQHINRTAMPEAKRIAQQAWLGLKNAIGESLIKLLFRLLVKELVRDVLNYLISQFIQ